MAMLTIMTRLAVLVAGTAVLLALQTIAGPPGLSHSSRPGKHQPCDRAFFSDALPRGASLENVTVVRNGDSYGEGEANVGYPKNPTHLPPLCAVTVRVTSSPTSSYRFGLFLPEDWNSRFLVVGNGGFAGGINWLDMAAGARYGMASLSTDTGHSSKSTNTTWARNQPEMKADWGWRAIHGSTVLGKKLARAYYAQQRLTYSYYSGCSTGGRQGLKELQNFPDSFDGALIGAAAWWTSHLNTYVTQAGLYNLPETDPKHLTDDDVALLADEITRQCDGLDGVEDGIISSPDLCHPNFDTLLCPSPKRTPNPNSDPTPPKCLSHAQLTTAHNMYSDYRSTTTNEFLHPGLTPGSEPQWHVLINGSEPSPYGVGYARDFLFDSTTNHPAANGTTASSWDWHTFNESVVQYAALHDPGQATADDYAALAAVRKRGGKVLLYHGMSDGLVPTKGTELYYRRTVEALRAVERGWWWWWWGPFLGRLGLGWGRHSGEDDDGGVDDFLSMFLVPGMQHCAGTAVDAPWNFGAASQAGALGNDTWSVPGFEDAQHDALLALVDWVEKGKRVERIVATTWEDPVNSTSGVKRQRPICAWPRRAVWDGRGDVDDAGSWWCSR